MLAELAKNNDQQINDKITKSFLCDDILYVRKIRNVCNVFEKRRTYVDAHLSSSNGIIRKCHGKKNKSTAPQEVMGFKS